MARNSIDKVDNIVSELNGMSSNQDFDHVAQHIGQLQQSDRAHFQDNLAQINQSVDMKNLGFKEDFQIVGVQPGKIVALSEDKKQFEFRDVHNMNKEFQVADNASEQQTIGAKGREAKVYPDGSADYTVAKNDNLWSISRDVLAERSNRPPTQNEIGNFVHDVAVANHIENNPGSIKPGDVIHIPALVAENPTPPLHPDANPARLAPTTMEAGSNSLTPKDEVNNPAAPPGWSVKEGVIRYNSSTFVYNPAAPPGLSEGKKDEVWDSTRGDTASRRNLGSETDPRTGNVTHKYDGLLDNGYFGNYDVALGRTTFTANETSDQSGNLTHRRIDYDGRGPSLKFQGTNGPISIDHVKSVETQFKSSTGRYYTEIVDGQGTRYSATTSGDGEVTYMGTKFKTVSQ